MTELSTLLRSSTRSQHEHAETRSFVSDLMGGKLGKDAYIDLARQHFIIYSHLEGASERFADDPLVGRFVIPEIARLGRIRADLFALCGEAWESQIDPLPATRVYADRLAGIASPTHFLAHAYTRYLGDLSGGQAIAAMLRRHYGISPDQLTFYSFDVGKLKVFKDHYRQMMDDVPFTPEQKQEVAAEAQVAFEFNAAVFVELGELHPAATLV